MNNRNHHNELSFLEQDQQQKICSTKKSPLYLNLISHFRFDPDPNRTPHTPNHAAADYDYDDGAA